MKRIVLSCGPFNPSFDFMVYNEDVFVEKVTIKDLNLIPDMAKSLLEKYSLKEIYISGPGSFTTKFGDEIQTELMKYNNTNIRVIYI